MILLEKLGVTKAYCSFGNRLAALKNNKIPFDFYSQDVHTKK